MSSAKLIYKIVHREIWAQATEDGVFAGAEIDLSDGFIHFSSADQVTETANKHFAGQSDLLLVAVDTADLGDALRWEPSRGGDLFPHLYGTLNVNDVCSVQQIPLDNHGNFQFSHLKIE